MKAEDALKLLEERVCPVVGAEEVALSEAHGRFLAAGVVSDRDVPGFDNSAIDGYAFAFADLAAKGETRLPVTDRAAAGHPAAKALEPGGAGRIFTGGVVPEGAGDARPNSDHLYFAVSDLEATYSRAEEAAAKGLGAIAEGEMGDIAERPWGERSFYANDPFGNPVCFVDERTLFTGGRFVP